MTATTNSFGRKIIQSIEDEKIAQALIENLEIVFLNLGVHNAKEIATKIVLLEKQEGRTLVFEEKAFKILEENHIHTKILQERMKRSQVAYNQIKDYVIGKQILDLGCGNGEIGLLLTEKKFNVSLTDVYEHPAVKKTNLPFKMFKPGKSLNYKNQCFDTTLLLTVLHHAEDPLQLLEEAKRVTSSGGRIIVIESVIGIKGKGRKFFRLTEEQQFQANCFFDYFSNRVMQYTSDITKKINVPCNFNTPQGWKDIFKNAGLKEIKRVDLGFDQAVVPEYHTLHILEVK